MTTTIDINHGVLRGGDYNITGDATANGPGKFAPDTFADVGNATINARVIAGTFDAGTVSGQFVNAGTLTFNDPVAKGVSANLVPQSIITLNDPHDFHGTIGFIAPPMLNAPFGEYVDLVGLITTKRSSPTLPS
jgi:hypothetical protein